uniref:Reeler domain containing 1 n=1 Tax=Anolis carolinensis TaxID=28377 RepID=A0A803TG82_ANOCA
MKVQALLLVWAITILCLVSYTAGFSHGASLSACTDMRPKHIRAHLQNPQNKYITIHTNMSFSPGDKVPVTVRSTRDFMGFMLQARRVLNDQIAGTFVYIPPGSKLLTCFEDEVLLFLSVVQSYFVYWARIESSTVSQQTQNKTATENRQLEKLIRYEDLKIKLQRFCNLNPLLRVLVSRVVENKPAPSFLCPISILFLLPVFALVWETNFVGLFIPDYHASSQPSLLQAKQTQLFKPLPIEHGLQVGRVESQYAHILPNATSFTTSPQEEKGKTDISGNIPLKVTRKAKATVSRGGGRGGGPEKEPQLVAAQLGVLLGCSAVLGMVLAITLRCIHSQYCHKRTEVSFSEPDSNVIALQENGEMMHFRKIRENSFVLVQAEYNWISPSGSGKKAAI